MEKNEKHKKEICNERITNKRRKIKACYIEISFNWRKKKRKNKFQQKKVNRKERNVEIKGRKERMKEKEVKPVSQRDWDLERSKQALEKEREEKKTIT